MRSERLLDFSDDPTVSPGKILSLLPRFLPFAVETFTERLALFDMPGYEPGLRESNLAVVLAEGYLSSMRRVFGEGSCFQVAVRASGACRV